MPELPELEVVCEVLQRRILGQSISALEVLPPGGPIVVRDLTGAGFVPGLTGLTFDTVARRGKFLVFAFLPEGSPALLINPKLTGRLQLAAAGDKKLARTHVIFRLEGGGELRYSDQKQMGQLYLTRDPARVPDFAGLGPEPFALGLEEFRQRLKHFRGEIKGVLTRGEFVAGIGNAYADEILWAARLHPFRKSGQMSAGEVECLHQVMQTTLMEAVGKVRVEMQEHIERKPRDFLMVHMRTGEPCPRCGTSISLVGANQRITNFCRTCQPGGLIKGM